MRFEPLEKRVLLSLSEIIDDDSPGFDCSPGWWSASNPAGYEGDWRAASPGIGDETATWTFDELDSTKSYQLLATWGAHENRASNAPYSIYDGTDLQVTYRFNQQYAPNDDSFDGQGWESLGVFTPTSGTLVVELSDDVDGYVLADAIHLVEVVPPTEPPGIIDDGDAGFTQSEGWWNASWPPAGYEDDWRATGAGVGSETASWTFEAVDPAKSYQVLATWGAHENRATNAPYSIYDGTDLQATYRFNQQYAPDDDTFDGEDWESLGVYNISSGTLVVELSDDANGYVIADAIRLVEVVPPTEPPEIIDDGDAGFAQTEGWWNASWPPAGYEDDWRATGAGAGSETASWEFGSIVAGSTVEVFATWGEHSNRGSDVPYTVYDGVVSEATVRIDQRVAPDDEVYDGEPWESLGSYVIDSGTLVVELSDDSDGYVIADAIWLSVTNTPPVFTSTATPSVPENTTAVVTVAATDADLPAQTVTYSITGGLDQALFSINGTTGELTFLAAPDYEIPGDAGADNIYNVDVTADDGNGGTTVQNIAVSVTDVNEPPIVNAGGPYIIDEGQPLTLSGSATDPEGGPLSYAWDLDGDGFDDATGSAPTVPWTTLAGLGLPSNGTPVQIRLQATDAGTLTGTAATNLFINNLPPIADADGPYTIIEGKPLALSGSATDPGGDLMTYAWDLDDDGVFDDAAGPAPTVPWTTLAALGLSIGTPVTIALKVTDFDNSFDTSAATLTITSPNAPPTVELSNTTTALLEDTDTYFPVKVADIVVTDDGVGTNELSLTGDDASLFEIAGSELYLKAGVILDYQMNPYLDVTVEVDDVTVGDTPDDTASLSITVVDLEDPPTGLVFIGDGHLFIFGTPYEDVVDVTLGSVQVTANFLASPFECSLEDFYAIDVFLFESNDLFTLDDGFTTPVTAYGHQGDDILEGAAGADTIYGGEGSDSIYGAEGNDEIDAGDGYDTIDGGFGEDTIYGYSGDNSITGGDGGDSIMSGWGYDTIDGGAGNDVITAAHSYGFKYIDGGTDNDSIIGGDSEDTIWGGDGDDTIYGGGGYDEIDAGEGNNFVVGDGDDTMYYGDDTIYSGSGADTVDGGLGNDTIYDSGGMNTVAGGDGNDSIDAGSGDNTITGGDGDDTITGGYSGSNDIEGGAGNDSITGGYYSYNDIDGGTGNDSIAGGYYQDTIHGGDGDDTIWGGDGDDTIYGGGGYDEIDAGEGNNFVAGDGDDTICYGNDTIYSGYGYDSIDGGGGDDTIYDSGGMNTIAGGLGNDSIYAGDGDNTIAGGDGDDTITGGYSGNNDITGGDGNDSITGGYWGYNNIDGGAGNDSITGGYYGDTILGGDGDDLIYADSGYDYVEGGAGNDSIYGGYDSDSILGEAGADMLYGESGNDWIDGGTEDDWIDGGNDYDTILGREGNDWLYGGDGDDSMQGGAGDDYMAGGFGSDSLEGEDGHDDLYGQDGSDLLQGDLAMGNAYSDIMDWDENDQDEGGMWNDPGFNSPYAVNAGGITDLPSFRGDYDAYGGPHEWWFPEDPLGDPSDGPLTDDCYDLYGTWNPDAPLLVQDGTTYSWDSQAQYYDHFDGQSWKVNQTSYPSEWFYGHYWEKIDGKFTGPRNLQSGPITLSPTTPGDYAVNIDGMMLKPVWPVLNLSTDSNNDGDPQTERGSVDDRMEDINSGRIVYIDGPRAEVTVDLSDHGYGLVSPTTVYISAGSGLKVYEQPTGGDEISLLDLTPGTQTTVYVKGLTEGFYSLKMYEPYLNVSRPIEDTLNFEVRTEVAIKATNAWASENTPAQQEMDDIGMFTISRGEGNTAGYLTVYYEVLPSSTATPGTDFPDSLYGSVTIPSGYSSTTIPIRPNNDEIKEWDETIEIVLTGTSSSFAFIGSHDTATVTILDNDQIGGFVKRNIDTETTGEVEEVISNGTVTVGIQEGHVRLEPFMAIDAFTPSYRGDDNLYPIVSVEMPLPETTSVPDEITATLTFGNIAGQPITFDTSDIDSTDDVLRFVVLGGCLDTLPTGHYEYDVQFVAEIDGETFTRTIRGSTEIVNLVTDETQFGNRHWIDALDRLVPGDGSNTRLADRGLAVAGGMALMRGDNTSAWYVAGDIAAENALIVDNGDSGYSESGDWEAGTHRAEDGSYNTAGRGQDYQFYTGGSTATATWTFNTLPGDPPEPLQPGRQYQLFATWVPGADRASDVPYTITGATPVRKASGPTVVSVDQRFTPGEIVYDGTHWRSLGYYTLDSGSTQIVVEIDTTGVDTTGSTKVVADAVMLVDDWTHTKPDDAFTELDYDSQTGDYTLSGTYGNRYEFDEQGFLTRHVDRNNNRVQFGYNGLDLTGITLQGGLHYTVTGSSVTDYAGRTLAYPGTPEYDFGNGLMSAYTDARGNRTVINYDPNTYRVTSVVNADNFYWEITPFLTDGLDGTVRRPVEDSAIGNRESLNTSDFDEPRATYTDPRASDPASPPDRDYIWTYQTDHYGLTTAMANPYPYEDVWRWVRQDNGLLVDFYEPPGGGGIDTIPYEIRTHYVHDARANLTDIYYAYEDPLTHLGHEQWTYDPQFSQVETYTDPMGRKTIYTPDAYGNVIMRIETSTAGPVRQTDYDLYTPAPSSIDDVPGGLLKSVTFAAGTSDAVTTETTYYEDHDDRRIGLVKTVTYASGTTVQQTQTHDYDLKRNPISVTNNLADDMERKTEYVYDDRNRLEEVKGLDPGTGDHLAPITSYHYDDFDNLEWIIDARGNLTDYYYDQMNRLETTQLPAPGGHSSTDQTRPETTYVYDANGNIKEEKVLIAEGEYRITKHDYDERNLLTRTEYADPGYSRVDAWITDSLQRVRPVVTYVYDALGNVKWETDPRYGHNENTPVRTEYAYDELHRTTRVISPKPHEATLNPVVSYTYYADGQVKTITAPSPKAGVNNTTTYEYDGLGRLDREIMPPDGKDNQLAVAYTYDLRDNIKTVTESGVVKSRVTTNYYDALDRLIAVDGPDADGTHPGVSTYTSYNAAGDTTFHLVFAGQVSAGHIADGQIIEAEINAKRDEVWTRTQNNVARKTTFEEYDKLGRVKKIASSVGVTTTYTYDAVDNIEEQKVEFTDAAGPQTLTMTKQYDSLSRAWRTNPPGGPETQIGYHADGNVQFILTENPNDISGWDYTSFDYDGLGRVKTTWTEDEADEGDGLISTTTYRDAAGNVTRRVLHSPAGNPLQTLNYYGKAGELFKSRAEKARTLVGGSAQTGVFLTTYYTYNTDGSVRNQRQAATNSDGTTVHDSYGNGITFDYDNLGRVVKQTRDNGRYEKTKFTYDVFGFRTSLTDPEDNVTFFTVDSLGRTTHETRIGYPNRFFSYDSFGNLLESNDRNGNVISYGYDDHGRLDTEEWINDPDLYVANYDFTPLGELEKAQDVHGPEMTSISEYDYVYDVARRLHKETQKLAPLNNQAVDFVYTNNILGQVTGVTADLEGTINDFVNGYEYDNRGRMKSAGQVGGAGSSVASKAVIFNYAYTEDENVPLLETLTSRYVKLDPQEEPTLSATSGRYDYLSGGTAFVAHYKSSGQAIAESTYLLDPRNLIVVTDTLGLDASGNTQQKTLKYEYDRYGQLTQTKTTPQGGLSTTEDIEYDTNGNRLGDTIGTYNRLTASRAARADYFYDNEGNVRARWNYDLVANVEDPSGNNDEFHLPNTYLYSGIYRMVFTDVVVNKETFDIALWNFAGSNEKLYEKTGVTATPVGDGTYVLNATLHFELTESYQDGYFDIHFDEGTGDPSILSGEVDLEKFQGRQGFEWDYRNRLVKVKKYTELYNPNTTDTATVTFPGIGDKTLYLTTSKEYLYDVHDQLIHTETYNETGPTRSLSKSRTNVYERGHCVVELHHDSTSDETIYRLYGAGVDMPLAIDRPELLGTTWTLTDHQGTVRDLVGHNPDKSLRHEHVEYTPFGVPTASGGLPGGVSTFYAGRDLDRFTDLYYNRARWYDAGSGRFISEDPIASDTNPYRYAGNSPMNATDPSGLFAGWLLRSAYSGESIYGVIPTDSWIGGFYESAGSALASTNPEFFANANAWTLLGGTAAFATGVVLTGGALGYGTGVLGASGATAFALGGAGASAGLYSGLLQTYAANPNAGFGQYALGGGLGALFGGFMPVGGGTGLLGTLGGAGIGSYFGDPSMGAQIGGLTGNILGAGLSQGIRVGVQQGLRSGLIAGAKPLAWQGVPATAGFGIGYGITGNVRGGLYGANIGSFVGGIGQGVHARYSKWSLGGLRGRIDEYGRRALRRAFDKGLSGLEAGRYADRYLSKAVYGLNRRLQQSGSAYRVYSQYGRNALGQEFWGMNRPAGTRFLDVALTNVDRSVVYSGWDITFHGTTRARWNPAVVNADYLQFFGIEEGFVREIATEATRPVLW